jgi:pilus assembly protein Flp/PilA
VFNLEQKMTKYLKSFIRDESGATAIEYGLIASLIGVAIIAGVRALGTNLSGTFAKVSGNLA